MRWHLVSISGAAAGVVTNRAPQIERVDGFYRGESLSGLRVGTPVFSDLQINAASSPHAASQKDVAFAPTLYIEEVRVATKTKSGITGLAQLANRTVSATSGTTAVQLIRKHERATGVDFKEIFARDNSEGFLLLENDRADAFVADGQILATMISQSRQSAS